MCMEWENSRYLSANLQETELSTSSVESRGVVATYSREWKDDYMAKAQDKLLAGLQ